MKKKNVIGILNKVIENSKDRLIKSECRIWTARQKNIDSLIRTLERNFIDFKVLGYHKRYNSERLFIEPYNTFEDKK